MFTQKQVHYPLLFKQTMFSLHSQGIIFQNPSHITEDCSQFLGCTLFVLGSMLKLKPVHYNLPSDTLHSQKSFTSLKRESLDYRRYQTRALKEENKTRKSSEVLPHHGVFLQLDEKQKLQKEMEVNKDIPILQGPRSGWEIHKKQGTRELTFISLTTSHMYTNSQIQFIFQTRRKAVLWLILFETALTIITQLQFHYIRSGRHFLSQRKNL